MQNEELANVVTSSTGDRSALAEQI